MMMMMMTMLFHKQALAHIHGTHLQTNKHIHTYTHMHTHMLICDRIRIIIIKIKKNHFVIDAISFVARELITLYV